MAMQTRLGKKLQIPIQAMLDDVEVLPLKFWGKNASPSASAFGMFEWMFQ